MNKITKVLLIFCTIILFSLSFYHLSAQSVPRESTMAAMVLANKYFMDKWPDVGKTIITERERPSNIWTRGTYYEGLMALYKLNPDPKYLDYAVRWGEFHKWGLRNGTQTLFLHTPSLMARAVTGQEATDGL
jgi:rhamnogalacturonyl hydrolase YesR